MQPSKSSRAPTDSRKGPPGPLRTCVGCRAVAPRSVLARVVLHDGLVVADVGASRPGRGAWLHRDPECLALAIRRQAFARAFRTGVADVSALELS